jgi:hypothetical protein
MAKMRHEKQDNSNEKGDGCVASICKGRSAGARLRGRLKSRVRQAFRLFGGKPLTTTELVEHCYCWVLRGEKIKSWHRSNIARVADVLAIRIGRTTSQGRPIMWSPRPELMQDERWVGLKP